jgi:chromobox protein 5
MARESPEFEDDIAMNVDQGEKNSNVEGSDTGDDDASSEYEIEQILDAKRGAFPDVRYCLPLLSPLSS